MKNVLALISVITIVFSCQSNSYPDQVAELDDMIQYVQVLEYRLDSLNYDEIQEDLNQHQLEYASIRNNYQDTSNREFWFKDMQSYRSLWKCETKLIEGKDALVKELKFSENQFAKLKNAFLDASFSEDSLMSFLSDEKMAFAGIMEKSTLFYHYKEEIQDYDQYKHRTDSIYNMIK